MVLAKPFFVMFTTELYVFTSFKLKLNYSLKVSFMMFFMRAFFFK